MTAIFSELFKKLSFQSSSFLGPVNYIAVAVGGDSKKLKENTESVECFLFL